MNIFRHVDDFVFGGSRLRMVISLSAIISLSCLLTCLFFGSKEHYSSIQIFAACTVMFAVLVFAFLIFGAAMQDSSDSSPTNSSETFED